MTENKAIPDQDALNLAIQKMSNIKIHVLDPNLFPNGFLYFISNKPQRDFVQPILVHANWVRDQNAKVYRARELRLWTQDPDERYLNPGKLFTYSLEDDCVSIEQEKNYLKVGYLIAKALQRKLVLPLFHCYQKLEPFCTFDVIFDSYPLHEQLSAYEHSFLLNKKIPTTYLHKKTIKLSSDLYSSGSMEMRDLLQLFSGLEDVDLVELIIDNPPCLPLTKNLFSSLVYIPQPEIDLRIISGTDTAFTETAKSLNSLIKFNTELLFAPWYTYWKSGIKEDFICVILDENYDTDCAVNTLKNYTNHASTKIYLLSSQPTFPNPLAKTMISHFPKGLFQSTSRVLCRVVFCHIACCWYLSSVVM